MMKSLRQHSAAVSLGGVVALGAIAWVAFGYFGVHTLFIDETVSEAAPVFDQPAADAAAPTTPTSERDATPSPTSNGNDPDEEPGRSPAAADEPSPTAAPAVPDPPATTSTSEAEVVTELAGSFTSDAHPTTGVAVVLGNGTGQRFVRFEDFETDNGPDLNVYLVDSSTGVSDYIDLGDLKGNIGEQNYEIPRDVDLSRYDRVVIWCVRFGVGFGHADLTAT